MNLFNDQPPTGLLAVPKAMRNGFYLHEHMPHPLHMFVPCISLFVGLPKIGAYSSNHLKLALPDCRD